LKIEGEYTFEAPREKVWQVLLDPRIIAQCIPGCKELREIGPNQYEARILAGAKGDYQGKVWIKEKRAPEHFTLCGESAAGPGFMVGDVLIDLEGKGKETVVKYRTEAKVSGWLAAAGQKMVGSMARMMADQFFKKVESFI